MTADSATRADSPSGARLPHPLQKTDQQLQFGPAELTKPPPVLFGDRIVDPFEDLQRVFGDPRTDEPTIGPAPCPGHEPRVLHPVEQARHVRHARQHAIADFVAAQPVRFGAAQNAKHVVLRERKPLGFQDLLELV